MCRSRAGELHDGRVTPVRLGALLGLIVGGVAAIALALSGSRPGVLALDCRGGKPAVRPATLRLTCSGETLRIVGIGWSAWGSSKATGSGRLAIDSQNVDLTASDVRGFAGRRYFTVLQLRFPDARFQSDRPSPTRTVRCPLADPAVEGGGCVTVVAG